jgi:ferritin
MYPGTPQLVRRLSSMVRGHLQRSFHDYQRKMIDPFNEQIQSEFMASAQYVAIAIYFDDRDLPELGRFFYRQAEEEREHAMKFVHFMLETGAKPLVSGLPDIRNEFGSAAEAVEFALNQEKKVTGQIYDLVTLATEARITPATNSCNGLWRSRSRKNRP